MPPEQLSRALKLFCGLLQDRLMKILKPAYFGRIEQSFLGKRNYVHSLKGFIEALSKK
jgi:hypothetical protein